MGIDPNLEDDDEQEDGASTGSTPPPSDDSEALAPPTDPTDPRAQLRQLIADNQAKNEAANGRLTEVQNSIGSQQLGNGLIAALAKSAAQIGSFNGRQADSSAVSDMAKTSDQAAQGQYADLIRSADRGEKDRATNLRSAASLLKGTGQSRFQPAGQDPDGNLLTLDKVTGQISNTGTKGQKLAGPEKAPPPSKFQQAGADEDGNLLLVDTTTGRVVKTGVKGQKVTAPPKPGTDDMAAERAWVTKYSPNVKGDKQLADANGILTSVDDARSLVQDAQTNPGSANSLAPVLARILSHGQRINMPEIESQEGGSKATFDRLQTIAQKAQSGTITPDQAKYVNQMLGVFQANATRTKNAQEGKHLAAYTKLSPTGATPEDARTYLGFGPAGAPPTSGAPLATAPAAGGDGTAMAAPAAAQDPKIAGYAAQHGTDYETAKNLLLKRGYKPNGQ